MAEDPAIKEIKQETWKMVVIWTLMTLFMVSLMTITIIHALR